jgi:Flp pilus assembly protein TadG
MGIFSAVVIIETISFSRASMGSDLLQNAIDAIVELVARGPQVIPEKDWAAASASAEVTRRAMI